MSGEGNRTESVVVVGAGPTGMSAALALRARDVPVTVIEADPEDRERPGSRAIYVHGSTLRTWERLRPGLGQRLAEEGLVWPTRRTYWRGREVFSRTYSDQGGTEGLPHFISHSQVRTEDELLTACRNADVSFVWDSPVTAVETGTDGVRVETESGAVWKAPYVVGADGSNSVVREEIGAEFHGDRSENSFVITDVAEDPDHPRSIVRTFHYEHPDLGRRNVLLVPFSGGWRVDLQCRASDDAEYWNRDDVVADWVGTVLGDRYADRVTWTSTYQFLQVTANTFVDGHRRVLLAGEAAHLFAPFGARGMNSGVADADAAASAIAVAIRSRQKAVARAEVEAYASERESAAAWNQQAASQALEHLLGDNPWLRVKKRAAATVAPWWEPAGEWLDLAPYGPRSGPPTTGGKY